ncbi:hypothetical protein QQS21_008022 [Conoideocrella luteorostrata]|uniref:Uncharacterized protein n=1 Tax=Conoideocrella luteorostrata TaxID=1105319 RepID=A0AAJ0CLX5_9HYPO|nr:hypothetical protein QQS21_008022 [Conoideocrella luteorostrata]
MEQVIGNRHADARCLSKFRRPVRINECIPLYEGGSVSFSKKGRCSAYLTADCKGPGKRVDASVKCHSVESWGNPLSILCGGPKAGGEAEGMDVEDGQ